MASRFDRQAAEYVRRASQALTDSSRRVGYAIYHTQDRPWYLLDVLAGLEREPTDGTDHDVVLGPWTETLSSAAYGAGTVIVATRGPDAMGGDAPGGADGDPGIGPGPGPGPARRPGGGRRRGGPLRRGRRRSPGGRPDEPFRDTATPNASFLYRGARNVELAIHLPWEGSARPTVADGRAVAALIAAVARVAKNRQSPITFLQTPTSSPPEAVREVGHEADGRRDETTEITWQPARTPAIRFAVALPARQPAERLGFFDDVAEAAQGAGARLWFADHRGDRRGGAWLAANEESRSRYEVWSRNLSGSSGRELRWIQPVTFVGPARVGTTFEIVDSLSARGVPIVTATLGSLKDLAFIHLGLGATGPDRSGGAGCTASGMLSGLAYDLGHGSGPVPLDKARDYTGYRGARVRLDRSPVNGEARAVWAAWQVPHHEHALRIVLASLRDALHQTLGPERSAGPRPSLVNRVNIEYVVCRRVETGELKGRCKLALPRGFEPQRSSARTDGRTALCQRVEERWRRLLTDRLGSSAVEVELTWRERWLGRWSTLLAGSMS